MTVTVVRRRIASGPDARCSRHFVNGFFEASGPLAVRQLTTSKSVYFTFSKAIQQIAVLVPPFGFPICSVRRPSLTTAVLLTS